MITQERIRSLEIHIKNYEDAVKEKTNLQKQMEQANNHDEFIKLFVMSEKACKDVEFCASCLAFHMSEHKEEYVEALKG